MRVLLVAHRYPPDRIAGVERYTQMLAGELVKAGDTVSIVSRRTGPSPTIPQILREQLPGGSVVYRLDGGEVSLDRFLVHHERLEDLFRAVVIETAPDVVHVNHVVELAPRFIEIARRWAPVVLTLHDFYFACPLVHLKKPSGELCAGPDGGRECARTCFAPEGASATLRWGLRTAYFRLLLSLANRIIAPSQYVASYFERFGVDPRRLRILPHGVPIEADRVVETRWATPRERGALNLAYVGNVERHKGAHVILDALQIAELDSVDLVVFGLIPDSEYGRTLRQRAAAVSGLKFRMYGAYESTKLRYLLDDVDCVVVPSQVPESFGLVPREVLGRWVPIVASRLGALPEVVTEGENGLTFDPGRPEELAAIFRQLADDDSLLRRLRSGARKMRFTGLSEHADVVRAVYREALQDRRPDRGDLAELEFLHSSLLDLGFAAGE